MTFIAVLVFIGSILIFLETILVGGIWAAIGLVCYLGAAYLAFDNYGVFASAIIGVLAAIMCIAAILVWIYVIPKTAIGKKFYLTSVQDGKAPAINFKSLLSKEGTALTELMPSGKVEIDSISYDASSDNNMHISKGDSVKVVSADAFGIKVRKL